MIINGISVDAPEEMTKDEAASYVDYVRERQPDVKEIKIAIREDNTVDIAWTAEHTKFERIRRITGYLTGVLDTWNDAKRSEERDRVKHVPEA